MWYQETIELKAKPRGFHLITDEVCQSLTHLKSIKIGFVHLLLKHTSASLTLNENCDASVRSDMENYFLKLVPERANYQHDYEGDDDMPAHIKSSLLGTSLLLPINSGKLVLGQWQGIWLGEHRNHGGKRRIIATLTGE